MVDSTFADCGAYALDQTLPHPNHQQKQSVDNHIQRATTVGLQHEPLITKINACLRVQWCNHKINGLGPLVP